MARLLPLAGVPGDKREDAMRRFEVLRPHIEGGATLTHAAAAAGVPLRTAQRWLANYRRDGLAGLTQRTRSDRGQRRIRDELVTLIEGLALRRPPPAVAWVHRQAHDVAHREGWPPPTYATTHSIVTALDPALVTLAHDGDSAYRDAFELLHRHEADHSNGIWQADHTQLDLILATDERPWLTVILDDRSRGVAGYCISLTAPSALHTSLAFRQAIWRKPEADWGLCGIPDVLYVDHGSDFTSRHVEQVAVDLHIQLIHSTVGRPQGRGKVERFFRTINQLLLAILPGYAPQGRPVTPPGLSLSDLDQQLRGFVIDYNHRPHSETRQAPQDRWAAGGFVPRMPDSLEALDLLLVTVAKPRVVHRDGIRFQGHRYIDPALAGYVGEPVTIRYDPATSPRSGSSTTTSSSRPRSARSWPTARSASKTSSPHAGSGAANSAPRSIGAPASSINSSTPTGPHHHPAPTPPTRPRPHGSSGTAMSETFLITKEYRRFVEFRDAVRRDRYIGLCYGPPGVGKTLSARHCAHWDDLEPALARREVSYTAGRHAWKPRTVVYTPTVTATPRQVTKDVELASTWLSRVIDQADDDYDSLQPSLPRRNNTELLIVDEADRLKMQALEALRDHFDRSGTGLVLIGMPGIERRLARHPQLYSRVGFAHEYRTLTSDELTFVLEHHYQRLGLTLSANDFTDAEAIAAVARITGGNFRLVHRLFAQITRILDINNLSTITAEVVDTARQNLVIGIP